MTFFLRTQMGMFLKMFTLL